MPLRQAKGFGMPCNLTARGHPAVSRPLDCAVDLAIDGAVVELNRNTTAAALPLAGEKAPPSYGQMEDRALTLELYHIGLVSSLFDRLPVALLLSALWLLLFA